MDDARRMAEEARRLRREEKNQHVARAGDVRGPTGAGSAGIVADGADRIALDPAELDKAISDLTSRRDELARHLQQAQELGGTLQDGKGPVTAPMRRAFRQRGGAGPGGVQTALREYLKELDALCAAIRQVRAVHQDNDRNTATAYRAVEM